MSRKNEIICVGLNHKTAPLDVREMVALTTKERSQAVRHLRGKHCNEGSVVLATCNRCEIYLSTTRPDRSRESARRYLLEKARRPEEVENSLYSYSGQEAVEHLFNVACGADSMVKGEVEVLKQVKDAYGRACEEECCDTYLHEAFNRALKTGKRARSETEISEHAASIGYAAVEKARKHLGGLEECSLLVLGAGDMGRTVSKNLLERGVSSPAIANRSYERSRRLADKIGGSAVEIEKLPEVIGEFDIIISCTAAPHYVIMKDKHGPALEERSSGQLLIDLAVPRDIDPQLESLDGVNLYKLDELEDVIDEGLEERERALQDVAGIIEEECSDYRCWKERREAAPVIADLKKKGEEIREAEMKRAINRLEESRGSLTPEQKEIIEELSRQIAKKILHDPVVEMQKLLSDSGCGENGEVLDLVSELFNLDDGSGC